MARELKVEVVIMGQPVAALINLDMELSCTRWVEDKEIDSQYCSPPS